MTMVNLLPEHEKKGVRAEYILRLSAVALSALALVTFIGMVLLLPSFFLIESKRLPLQLQAEQAKQVESEEDSPRAILIQTEAKLQVLGQSRGAEFVSELVTALLGEMPTGVKITSILYKSRDSDGGSVTIGGVAENRESLVTLTKRLERARLFSDVLLPVANLARTENISFSITTNSVRQR